MKVKTVYSVLKINLEKMSLAKSLGFTFGNCTFTSLNCVYYLWNSKCLIFADKVMMMLMMTTTMNANNIHIFISSYLIFISCIWSQLLNDNDWLIICYKCKGEAVSDIARWSVISEQLVSRCCDAQRWCQYVDTSACWWQYVDNAVQWLWRWQLGRRWQSVGNWRRRRHVDLHLCRPPTNSRLTIMSHSVWLKIWIVLSVHPELGICIHSEKLYYYTVAAMFLSTAAC